MEEFGASNQTLSLVRDQFESNYFGPVNIIKAVIPEMRRQKKGHILVLSGISMPCSYTPWVANDANSPIAGHIGTPGLGVYCASEWALEGFCDVCTLPSTPTKHGQKAANFGQPRVSPTKLLPSTSKFLSFNPASKSAFSQISSQASLQSTLRTHRRRTTRRSSGTSSTDYSGGSRGNRYMNNTERKKG